MNPNESTSSQEEISKLMVYKIQAYEQLKVIDDLRQSIAELIPIAELFARRVSLDPKEVSGYGKIKSAIERAKALKK